MGFIGQKAFRDSTHREVYTPPSQTTKPRLAEPAKMRRRTTTVSIPILIKAGYLPPGFTLSPSTHIVHDSYGRVVSQTRVDTTAQDKMLRTAIDRYNAAKAHEPGRLSPEVKAAHDAEYQWVHKNADNRDKGRSRKGKK